MGKEGWGTLVGNFRGVATLPTWLALNVFHEGCTGVSLALSRSEKIAI